MEKIKVEQGVGDGGRAKYDIELRNQNKLQIQGDLNKGLKGEKVISVGWKAEQRP